MLPQTNHLLITVHKPATVSAARLKTRCEAAIGVASCKVSYPAEMAALPLQVGLAFKSVQTAVATAPKLEAEFKRSQM
eukprot:SAG22_NODE_7537_length_730_cov_0.944532_1_plen_77_part_01